MICPVIALTPILDIRFPGAAMLGAAGFAPNCRNITIRQCAHSSKFTDAGRIALADGHRPDDASCPALVIIARGRSMLDRRRFIQTAAAMGAAFAWGGPARASRTKWKEARNLYPEGVASGDP